MLIRREILPGTPKTIESAGAFDSAQEFALTLLLAPTRFPGPTEACMPMKTSSQM